MLSLSLTLSHVTVPAALSLLHTHLDINTKTVVCPPPSTGTALYRAHEQHNHTMSVPSQPACKTRPLLHYAAIMLSSQDIGSECPKSGKLYDYTPARTTSAPSGISLRLSSGHAVAVAVQVAPLVMGHLPLALPTALCSCLGYHHPSHPQSLHQ